MGVFVLLFEAFLVNMWMCVVLPVVAVFVLVLDVLMVVQDMRVRMRQFVVRVLVSVRCGHRSSVHKTSIRGCRLIPLASMLHGPDRRLASISETGLNAPSLQLAKRRRCTFIPLSDRSDGSFAARAAQLKNHFRT